jgi:hypothetical protein
MSLCMLKHPLTQLPFQVLWSLFLEFSVFIRDFSIIPLIYSFSLTLPQQVSARKGGVFSMFPEKLSIILFISACSQETRFHHSLHIFILLDALMTGLCWKRWCILNVPKKTFPSIIVFISACSQEMFPSFPSYLCSP